MKAFLTARSEPFGKTHSLVELVQTIGEIDPDFMALRVQAETLTPFVTRFRYPGVGTEPEQVEAAEAICMAREILEFVLSRLDLGLL